MCKAEAGACCCQVVVGKEVVVGQGVAERKREQEGKTRAEPGLLVVSGKFFVEGSVAKRKREQEEK